MGILDFMKTREKIVREQNEELDRQIRALSQNLDAEKSLVTKRSQMAALQAELSSVRSGQWNPRSASGNSHRKAASPRAHKTTSRTSGKSSDTSKPSS